MNPNIDRYWQLKSPLHSWDPRIKIITLTLLAFSISFIHRLSSALLCLMAAILLLLVSKIPFSFSLKRLAAVTFFIGPFFLIMPLTIKPQTGDIIFFFTHLEFFEINSRGFVLAARIYLKAVSIIFLTIPMFGTNRFDVSIKALECLKMPNSIVQMILFSYRYIFLFIDELKRMSLSMKLRKFVPSTNLHTLKAYGNFLGTLLVRSFERSEDVYQAMVSRGYQGSLKIQHHFQIKHSDFFKSAGIFFFIFFILWYDLML